jgi:fructokinase
MIPVADPAGGHCLKPHAGGAVFNTAIALGRLGVPSHFLSGVSTDLFGKTLMQTLQDSNVKTGFVILSDRPTTLAFVELSDGHASYVFYDENTAGRMLSPSALPDIPQTAKALYFGGISLINEPAADFYLALALREAGKSVIMADPNIRANFVKDVPRYRLRLEKLIGCVDILKVSDEDLDWIIPGAQPHVEKAKILLQRGPKIVVLTRGADGACAFCAGGMMIEVPVQKVEVADTVGAGDTFNAGFLASLAENDLLSVEKVGTIDAADVTKALEYGANVAAITVSRAGANPPWKHELG